MRIPPSLTLALTGLLLSTAPAGAAPLPRGLKDPPWSATVDGLRIRLLSAKTVYKVGEPLELRVEIQNVSEKPVSFDHPFFLPTISIPEENGIEDSEQYSWVITAQPIGQKIAILWSMQKYLREVRESGFKIPPGGAHLVEIKAASGRKMEQEADRKRTAEDTKDAIKGLSIQKETLHFAYGGIPGRYRLKLSYRPHPDQQKPQPASWQGKHLETPAIEITLGE